MSRSGYSDDCEYIELYRAQVESALSGKRGQAFLYDLVVALDAMPEKKLIRGTVASDDCVCSLGALGKARSMDLTAIDGDVRNGNFRTLGDRFNIARQLAQEVMFENDQDFRCRDDETPEQRWARMRAWALSNLRPETLLDRAIATEEAND